MEFSEIKREEYVAKLLDCPRCGGKYEGLGCLCIQHTADLESLSLCRARLEAGECAASIWAKPATVRKFGNSDIVLVSHLRVRPGLTACGKKTPINSKYVAGLVTPKQARQRTDCPKCIEAMGWN